MPAGTALGVRDEVLPFVRAAVPLAGSALPAGLAASEPASSWPPQAARVSPRPTARAILRGGCIHGRAAPFSDGMTCCRVSLGLWDCSDFSPSCAMNHHACPDYVTAMGACHENGSGIRVF